MQPDQYINDATKTGLEQYAAIQQQVLEANKTMAETFGKIVPATPVASMIPGLSEPASIIEGSFEMATTVLAANKTMAETFGKIVPAAPVASMIPGLPEPASIIEDSFEMATTVLEANKKFYGELINIWSPAPAESN